jgi:hypothetical protein
MTPTEVTTLLRQFNEWRRDDEDSSSSPIRTRLARRLTRRSR